MDDIEQSARDHHAKKSGSPVLMVGVVVLVLVALVLVCSPIILRGPGVAVATRAISNGKDIYVGLRDYAFEHGGVTPEWSKTSNQAFAVLFETGHCQDEKPYFVAKSDNVVNARVGDEDTSIGHVLESGENCYAYWTNFDGSGVNITNDDANTPLLTIPALFSSESEKFHTAFYSQNIDGQAVVLTSDGAAMVYALNDNGQVLDEDNKRLTQFDSTGKIDYSQFKVAYPAGCMRVK